MFPFIFFFFVFYLIPKRTKKNEYNLFDYKLQNFGCLDILSVIALMELYISYVYTNLSNIISVKFWWLKLENWEPSHWSLWFLPKQQNTWDRDGDEAKWRAHWQHLLVFLATNTCVMSDLLEHGMVAYKLAISQAFYIIFNRMPLIESPITNLLCDNIAKYMIIKIITSKSCLVRILLLLLIIHISKKIW